MNEDIPSPPGGFAPGSQIAGYRLLEQIGQGGMAVVFRAHDERLDRQVALKILAPGLALDGAFRKRFIRESRAAAAAHHSRVRGGRGQRRPVHRDALGPRRRRAHSARPGGPAVSRARHRDHLASRVGAGRRARARSRAP